MAKEAVKPYSYFDTPDGHDVDKKLWFVLKPTTLCALGLSSADVLVYSKPKGYGPILARYVYYTVPFISMTTAFVLTTNIATNWRKKDDKLNWALGGVSAGVIFGIWRKSIMAGFVSSVVFGGCAILKKHAIQEGWILHPMDGRDCPGGLRSVRQDWTLTRDIPGNWTTGRD